MPRRGIQAYGVDMERALQGVALPPKIKCIRCEKFMNAANFSNKQLNDARFAVKNRAQYKIKCMRCTGGTLVELECMMCNEWKGLEEFAKSQRNKPDSAKCYKCIEEQVERPPVNDEVYEDPRGAFIPVENSAGNYPEYWSSRSVATSEFDTEGNASDEEDGGINLENNLRNMSLGVSSNTGTLIDSEDPYNNQSPKFQKNDVREATGAGSWRTESGSAGSIMQISGLNATNFDNTTRGGRSALLSSQSFGSNATERSANTQGTSGWPKVKAYTDPQNQQNSAFFQPSTHVREDDEWHSESEEEDGDDDDEDDSDVEI